MGFLSKIWKGIKTGASGIVKGIKGVIKSFGKFMDDIGIVCLLYTSDAADE